jgi:hypothetical protein
LGYNLAKEKTMTKEPTPAPGNKPDPPPPPPTPGETLAKSLEEDLSPEEQASLATKLCTQMLAQDGISGASVELGGIKISMNKKVEEKETDEED